MGHERSSCGDAVLKYWQKKFEEDQIVHAVETLGMEEACKAMKLRVDQVNAHIFKLKLRYDGEFFASTTLRINDKYGNVVPLLYNRGQKKIRDAIESQRLAGKPVRIALLKARQFGGCLSP